jgi:putative DNA primase/helicase
LCLSAAFYCPKEVKFVIKFSEVKDVARNRWDQIIPVLAPCLSEAVEKAPRHVDCPVHHGKNDFRFYRDFAENGAAVCTCCKLSDGFEVIAWANGWTLKDTLIRVAEYLGLDPNASSTDRVAAPAPRPQEPRKEKKPNPYFRDLLRKTWAESLPADHPQAEPLRLYLQKRGIFPATIPEALRFHPALPYFVYGADNRKRCIGTPPAMVAMVTDAAGKPVTLHRTYLDMKGNKSPVQDVKMLMPSAIEGAAVGGAIRLFPPGPVLAVTEGIETALAVHLATDMPVWACISTSFLTQVELPPEVERVLIWADLDKINPKTGKRPGEAAATELAERLRQEGRHCDILLPLGEIGPDGKGIDWCDVYVKGGKKEFLSIALSLMHGANVEEVSVALDSSCSDAAEHKHCA